MFLGISYNRWHGIIAYAGEIAIAVGLYCWLALDYWHAYLIAFWIGLTVQSLYEICQLYFTDVEEIYGSYRLFIKDSKDDFVNFFVGSTFALISILMLILLDTF